MTEILAIVHELARRIAAVGMGDAVTSLNVSRTLRHATIMVSEDDAVDAVWVALDGGPRDGLDRPRTLGDARAVWRTASTRTGGVVVFVHGPMHEIDKKGAA